MSRHLSLVRNIPNKKKDKSMLYINAYLNAANQLKDETIDFNNLNLSTLKKLILFGVKVINSTEKDLDTPRMRDLYFTCALSIKEMIKKITPSDFENIFPISKEFDGDRYQIKDYFYTKRYLKEIGEDVPIGENVNRLLWDYVNFEVSLFAINLMSVSSDIRVDNGGRSFMEEFCEEQGIKTHTLYTDDDGKKWLQDNETGEVQKVTRKKPRYLNIVK